MGEVEFRGIKCSREDFDSLLKSQNCSLASMLDLHPSKLEWKWLLAAAVFYLLVLMLLYFLPFSYAMTFVPLVVLSLFVGCVVVYMAWLHRPNVTALVIAIAAVLLPFLVVTGVLTPKDVWDVTREVMSNSKK